MVYLKLITTLSVAILWLVSADVISISECPKLAPRTSAAKDVTDLRIDDIQVVAALGDSAMAGFAMMGVTTKEETPGVIEFDFDFVREFRGNSYGIGGDTGAVTWPTLSSTTAQMFLEHRPRHTLFRYAMDLFVFHIYPDVSLL